MTPRLLSLVSFVIFGACIGLATTSPAATRPSAPPAVPGARTCFWFRPPVGADPYVNVAYPDGAARYWTAVFTTPPGAKLTLKGQFPHARYMSMISYDASGKPIEALADYRIRPDAGSVNPFIAGARRDFRQRDYSLIIADAPPTDAKAEGQVLSGSEQNLLHAPGVGAGHQQILIMRIYVPDQDRDVLGGVGLPDIELTMADGRKLAGQDACDALDTQQAPVLTPAALSIPLDQFNAMAHPTGKPAMFPATNPLTWYVQYDRKFLLGIYTGERPAGARKSEGGFFPNPDNNYIRAIVNRGYGRVLVLRGRMPTTPKTLAGEPVMGRGQLRYWSICSNQSFANTRVTDCLFDEQVPLDAQGYYTIVLSRKADRPRNAIPACGVAWLELADDGDGAGDPDAGILQIRNMLADPEFGQSVQAVKDIGTEKAVMGDYLPDARYMMTSGFESLVACPLG